MGLIQNLNKENDPDVRAEMKADAFLPIIQAALPYDQEVDGIVVRITAVEKISWGTTYN